MLNPVTLTFLAFITLYSVLPVAGHGYVTTPPSRQARCHAGEIQNCGIVQWEPQSVEAPAGSFLCNGGGHRFTELNDESLFADHFEVVPRSTESLTFTWKLTAPHRTRSWEYFLITSGETMLYYEAGHGVVPPEVVTHKVPVQGLVGRHTVLGRWTIADTTEAAYACVDLFLGGQETETEAAAAAATQVPVGMPYELQDLLGNQAAANSSEAPVAESSGGAHKAVHNLMYVQDVQS
ncbi:Lytic chitin monooxygenase [Psilocybe cubensis]|uniref:Chitin-binding type-4 domain-containing protein n=2 Tax=Psilocybe cubensis TaxID=181762 RepID=A0A8H7XU47_PSICU|nr:Lytic chitin monooxygenase [Psilocybe cubensis]KAH9475659.1 Lytic chitin monooxygenase [Psilocybe cubensis]